MKTSTNESLDEHVDTRGAVVIAVDGSEGNENAIAWATDEATRLGRRLVFVAATGEYLTPMPYAPTLGRIEQYPERSRTMVRQLTVRIHESHPGLSLARIVRLGQPSNVILEAAEDAEMVVVGQRGHGAFERVVVGSTSIAVAGRSPVPTVVVPDQWDAVSESGSIVVGVDPGHVEAPMMRIAFERARALGVPLTAVFGWRALPLFDWSPADLDDWGTQAAVVLGEILQPWRREFSDVEVVPRHVRAHPGGALLDAAKDAQLIVVGRSTGAHHRGGFHIGSTTRSILHYTPCPVMVVPELVS